MTENRPEEVDSTLDTSPQCTTQWSKEAVALWEQYFGAEAIEHPVDSPAANSYVVGWSPYMARHVIATTIAAALSRYDRNRNYRVTYMLPGESQVRHILIPVQMEEQFHSQKPPKGFTQYGCTGMRMAFTFLTGHDIKCSVHWNTDEIYDANGKRVDTEEPVAQDPVPVPDDLRRCLSNYMATIPSSARHWPLLLALWSDGSISWRAPAQVTAYAYTAVTGWETHRCWETVLLTLAGQTCVSEDQAMEAVRAKDLAVLRRWLAEQEAAEKPADS